MKIELDELARAIIAEAVAGTQAQGANSISALHLTFYPIPNITSETVRAALDLARRDTMAQEASLHLREAAARYICWNCCGLRFEEMNGVCPNCESEAMPIPDEAVFALDRVDVQDEADRVLQD